MNKKESCLYIIDVFIPLARNTIAIKFAEDDHSVAEMVARAFTLFENFCTSDQAYAFYNEMMENPKLQMIYKNLNLHLFQKRYLSIPKKAQKTH